MGAVVGIILLLIVLWISFKVVKFFIRVALWLFAIGIVVALLGYYLPISKKLANIKVPVKVEQTTNHREEHEPEHHGEHNEHSEHSEHHEHQR